MRSWGSRSLSQAGGGHRGLPDHLEKRQRCGGEGRCLQSLPLAAAAAACCRAGARRCCTLFCTARLLPTPMFAELRRALSRHLQQHEQGSSEEVLLVRRAQLRHRLPFRSEPYSLTLHVPPQQRQAGAEAEPCSPRQRAAVAAAVAATASGPAEAGAAALVAPTPAPAAAAAADLWDAPHRLQTWFGLGAFLLLTPDSYSGRVLEAEVGAEGAISSCIDQLLC